MTALPPVGREAAYGPPASVLSVIRTYRNREVPETITETTLTQLGIKDSLTRLVLRSLVFLGLLTEAGTTTEKFKALRYATDDNYTTVLSEIVTAAYLDIIAIAPPEVSTRPQLANAFRPYSPASQHDRMITLFLALCKEAGMAVAQPAKDSSTRPATGGVPKPKPKVKPATAPPTPAPDPLTTQLKDLDPTLVSWLVKLPTWPEGGRDNWFTTFKAIMQGVYPDDNIT